PHLQTGPDLGELGSLLQHVRRPASAGDGQRCGQAADPATDDQQRNAFGHDHASLVRNSPSASSIGASLTLKTSSWLWATSWYRDHEGTATMSPGARSNSRSP